MKQHLKVSLILTVLNEEKTVLPLLTAISKQILKPAEVIIVDGGSTDNTLAVVKDFSENQLHLNIKAFSKKGNRSVGRNWAIRKANHNWIAITDAGCIPESDWLEGLVKRQGESKASVIAGYYRGLAQTPFTQAVIPYVLVMPNKVNTDNFLPATRSMLIAKEVWSQLGGFNESLSDNEDYAFARQIQSQKIKISLTTKAIVNWIPRTNLRSFAWMIFRFARGDVQAKIIRPKVVLIFIRYLFFLVLTIQILWQLARLIPVTPLLIWLWIGLIVLYAAWSIQKNIKHVPDGWYWLPILQVVSDWAVMIGSVVGIFI